MPVPPDPEPGNEVLVGALFGGCLFGIDPFVVGVVRRVFRLKRNTPSRLLLRYREEESADRDHRSQPDLSGAHVTGVVRFAIEEG
ncbi:hypothetical protein [Natronorarus salvus]|uniref:hypothetical protein n=1 Tax=Natronorarus salvus TaxID=3117733 RepID=UPI002F26DE83